MHPAIFAPAGNYESLQAALNAGADGVYFGAGSLNMRAGGAVNFSPEELPGVIARCHDAGAGAYLALNTIICDGEKDAVRSLCTIAGEAGIDGIIAGDPAVLSILRELHIPAHITVQCNVANIDAVKFYAPYADVMVLAREVPLGTVQRITEAIRKENICGPSGNPVKIEVFAHGALCVGISGLCSMSMCTYGRSANRGKCLQNCRRRYRVQDVETGMELEIDNEYVMSPKDIRTVPFLDRILDAGVSVLKIEGRGRPADYVHTTVSVYKEARDAWKQGIAYTPEMIAEWNRRLETVFNRGFWEGGHYLGNTLDAWCKSPGNLATYRKEQIGLIEHYFSKASVASVKITSGVLREGDKLLISGGSTGAMELTVRGLRVDDQEVMEAGKGTEASFAVPGKVRAGDRVQILKERIAEEEI